MPFAAFPSFTLALGSSAKTWQFSSLSATSQGLRLTTVWQTETSLMHHQFVNRFLFALDFSVHLVCFLSINLQLLQPIPAFQFKKG